MGIVLTVTFILVLLLTLYEPFWGVVGILGFTLAEKLAVAYIPLGANYITAVTLITGVSFVFGNVIGKGQNIYVGNKKFMILLGYVFYLAITSLDTFFTDTTRNWALTYTQSILMVVLIANTVRSYADVRKIMMGVIVIGFLSTLVYLTQEWLQVFEQEIEGSNTYGRLFLVIMIFAYSLMQSGKQSNLMRIFYGAVILIILLGLLTTGSRTSFVLLAALVVYFLLKTETFRFSQVIIVGVVMFGLFFLVPEGVVDSILLSFDDSTYEGGGGNTQLSSISHNARLLLWDAGFRMLNDYNWFIGIGVGNYRHLVMDYIPIIGSPVSHPHNTYISVLVESGIIGLAIFVRLIYLTFVSMRRYRFVVDPEKRKLMEAWFLALVVFLIGGLTKHDHYDKLLFLFIGISIVFDRLRNAREITLHR